MHIHFTITSDLQKERWDELMGLLKSEIAAAIAHEQRMEAANQGIANGIRDIMQNLPGLTAKPNDSI